MYLCKYTHKSMLNAVSTFDVCLHASYFIEMSNEWVFCV